MYKVVVIDDRCSKEPKGKLKPKSALNIPAVLKSDKPLYPVNNI